MSTEFYIKDYQNYIKADKWTFEESPASMTIIKDKNGKNVTY